MDFGEALLKFFKSAIGKTVGAGFTISVLLSVIQIAPKEWASKLGAWGEFIRQINPNLIWGSVVLLLIVVFGSVYKEQGGGGLVKDLDQVSLVRYSKDALGRRLRRLIESGEALEIKVFAYTAETLRDYITYADRYRYLTIRILIRDWEAEKWEEENYNRELKLRDPQIRPWRKWKRIRTIVEEFHDEMQSQLAYRVSVRLYRSVPTFKGVLVVCQDRVEAFLGFYKWVEWPPEGGSRYKGEGAATIHLVSTCGPLQKDLIERIDSHFERIWLMRSRPIEEYFSNNKEGKGLAPTD